MDKVFDAEMRASAPALLLCGGHLPEAAREATIVQCQICLIEIKVGICQVLLTITAGGP
jgi:hypothetical protein